MKTVLLVMAVVWGGSLVALVCGIAFLSLFGREKDRSVGAARRPAPAAEVPAPLPPAPPPVAPAPVPPPEPPPAEEPVVFRKLRKGRIRRRSRSGVDGPA